MCVVSAIVGNQEQRWQQVYPWAFNPPRFASFEVSEADWSSLKKEVEELRTLIVAAKKYDEFTLQPHCEHADKVALMRRLADMVGVSYGEIFDDD